MITNIKTTDSVYSWTPDNVNSVGLITEQKIQNNNEIADTQGFLVKVQVGDNRITQKLSIKGTKTDIETNILPMLTYPVSIKITFDRNILTKTVKYMEAVIKDYDVKQEFDNGYEQEVEMVIVEVLQ